MDSNQRLWCEITCSHGNGPFGVTDPGMKKNEYGNIEDLLVDITLVTPSGVLAHGGKCWPRISSGPNVLRLAIGSEGTLGIITDATVKVRPLPEVALFDCFLFPNFETGTKCLREMARQRLKPASLRLMDNAQTQLGATVKPKAPGAENSLLHQAAEKLKKFYITAVQGLDLDEICGCTVLYEGTRSLVDFQKNALEAVFTKHGAISVGGATGRLGYQMTFAIAYIRDFVLDHNFMAESFEMSVPWKHVLKCVEGVRKCVAEDCKRYGVIYQPFITARLTQIYDEGACLYYYICFSAEGLDNPIEVFSAVEHKSRERAMELGASISHHHGVGKLRKDFIAESIGETELGILKSIKNSFDSKNVLGCRNIFSR
eukprot:GHVN01096120.1.p1 GENE.GHVN01096120.1~~GHVN01096120.1.p1  ORF type:complete len:372 (+),score=37.79 GHVN01096120.1:2211-3326(+)